MKLSRLLLACSIVYLLSGCQSLPQLSLDQVDAERQRLHAQGLNELEKAKATQDEKKYWIQPVNKKVKCLLPSDKAFLKEDGHFVVWDGHCKKGYAHGFGRSIAISDFTHIEEITVHDLNKKDDQLTILIDYINNHYFLIKRKNGYLDATNWIGQLVSKNVQNGSINYKFYLFNRHFGTQSGYVIRSNGVTPERNLIVQHPKYSLHWHQSNSDLYNLQSRFYTWGEDKIFGPVLESYSDGGVVTTFDGQRVVVPIEYWQWFDQEYRNFDQSMSEVDSIVKEADLLFRQYKVKVCSNPVKALPKGLTKERFLQVCDYEEKFFKELPLLKSEYQNQVNARINQLNQERMIRAQEEQAQAQRAQAYATYNLAREAAEANRIAGQLY